MDTTSEEYRAEWRLIVTEIESRLAEVEEGSEEHGHLLSDLEEAHREAGIEPEEDPNECGFCGGYGAVDDYWRGAGARCRHCNGTGVDPSARGEYFSEPEERVLSAAECDAVADAYFAHAFRAPY